MIFFKIYGENTMESVKNHCHHQQEINALIENRSDFLVVSFSVAAGDQNLCSDAETECHHEDGEVVYPCDGRCT